MIFGIILVSAVTATSAAAPAVEATAAPATTNATARITSDTTYYDRKEGIAVFKGHVHVDDTEYQMYADRAFLYMSGTNNLERIAALGSVVITNGLKRASGEKATYHRGKGVVVLTGSQDGATPAIVAEATPQGERVVRGRKIRFWVNQEQVEVVEAVIDAPKTGASAVLPALKR